MDQLLNDIGHPTYIPFEVIAARLFLAALLGAAIGFEREWQNRPAGLRTHMLVCLSGALIAILTVEITHVPFFQDEAIRVDPVRLVEAVTAGVAFLAAGLIIFARGEVHGLTTGAGMWLASAVGLACGLGFWQIALLAAVLTLAVLGLLSRLQEWMKTKQPLETPRAGYDQAAADTTGTPGSTA
ncbi:MAG: MgtC/SapB family protein [Rhizobiaceae bacterium]|nr:MgtC/SapB family protein [Rhizobiaceae bacterium]